jgi:glycerophosphoryl diester phosphodiesterase
MRSFARALDMGVGLVECDVHLTRDGRLAVIHDARLERTTDGRGRVAEATLAEIQKLDAGSKERVPALEELYDLVRGRARLVVEIKPMAAGPAVLDFVRTQRAFDEIMVISFWHPVVQALKQVEPRLHTGALMVGRPMDPVAVARQARADALVLRYDYVDGALMDAARAAGLEVFLWNIDDIETLEQYLPLAPQVICSNRPDVLINYLR